MIDALLALWDTIVAVAEAIADALASLVDWIWDAIALLFQPIIDSIQDGANSYFNSMMDGMYDLIEEYQGNTHSSGSISDYSLDMFLFILFGGFLPVVCSLLKIIIVAVINILTPFFLIIVGCLIIAGILIPLLILEAIGFQWEQEPEQEADIGEEIEDPTQGRDIRQTSEEQSSGGNPELCCLVNVIIDIIIVLVSYWPIFDSYSVAR